MIISEKLSEHPQWLFAIVLLAITGIAVSYTHLDVYKRQAPENIIEYMPAEKWRKDVLKYFGKE